MKSHPKPAVDFESNSEGLKVMQGFAQKNYQSDNQ